MCQVYLPCLLGFTRSACRTDDGEVLLVSIVGEISMNVPQINRYRALLLLLFLVTITLCALRSKPVNATSRRGTQFAQSTIPSVPTPSDPVFCATQWLFDRYPAAAAVLGMPPDVLWVALHDDKAIADFAVMQHVELAVVIAAIVAAETVHLQELVQLGCMTETVAAAKVANLVSEVTTFVHDQTPPAFLVCRVGWPAYDELTARILQLELLALYKALLHGQSIGSLAAAQGLNRQELIDALLAEKLAIIDNLVATQCVTARDGRRWQLLIPGEVTDFVDNGVDAATLGYWRNVLAQQPQLLFVPLLMR